ncbi:unnamed protein product, partial [Discosporangium mesarthrocarpum]
MCAFEEKAKVAEEEGAVGVVIVDNTPGGELVLMGLANPTPEAHLPQLPVVSIPIVLVRHEDGQEMIHVVEAMEAAGKRPVEATVDVVTVHQSLFDQLVSGVREGRNSGTFRHPSPPTSDPAYAKEPTNPGVGGKAGRQGSPPEEGRIGGSTNTSAEVDVAGGVDIRTTVRESHHSVVKGQGQEKGQEGW